MATCTAFLPKTTTKTIAASTTSAQATWSPADSSGDCIRVFNSSTAIAFVKIGRGSQTATAADLPIAPSAVEVIGCNDNSDTVAVLLSTGTGNCYFSKGEGI